MQGFPIWQVPNEGKEMRRWPPQMWRGHAGERHEGLQPYQPWWAQVRSLQTGLRGVARGSLRPALGGHNVSVVGNLRARPRHPPHPSGRRMNRGFACRPSLSVRVAPAPYVRATSLGSPSSRDHSTLPCFSAFNMPIHQCFFSGSILLQAVSSSLAAIAENPRNLYYWEFPELVHFSALRESIRSPAIAGVVSPQHW